MPSPVPDRGKVPEYLQGYPKSKNVPRLETTQRYRYQLYEHHPKILTSILYEIHQENLKRTIVLLYIRCVKCKRSIYIYFLVSANSLIQ